MDNCRGDFNAKAGTESGSWTREAKGTRGRKREENQRIGKWIEKEKISEFYRGKRVGVI